MSKNNNDLEVQAIQETILKYYHDGHAKYRPDLYKRILHPEWKFFMFDEDSLKVVDQDEFCSWYTPEKMNPDLEWETEFYGIDVTGDLATVKLRLENQKVRYIDHLNMMKLDVSGGLCISCRMMYKKISSYSTINIF